jgi:hypothetical protein
VLYDNRVKDHRTNFEVEDRVGAVATEGHASFGGVDLPSLERMWIETSDENTITYVWELTLDRTRNAEAFDQVITRVDQSAGPRADLPPEQRFDAVSRKTTVFDRTMRWPREVEFVSTLTVNGQEQQQIERWALVETPVGD